LFHPHRGGIGRKKQVFYAFPLARGKHGLGVREAIFVHGADYRNARLVNNVSYCLYKIFHLCLPFILTIPIQTLLLTIHPNNIIFFLCKYNKKQRLFSVFINFPVDMIFGIAFHRTGFSRTYFRIKNNDVSFRTTCS